MYLVCKKGDRKLSTRYDFPVFISQHRKDAYTIVLKNWRTPMAIVRMNENVFFHAYSDEQIEFRNEGYVTQNLIDKAIEFDLPDLTTELTSNKKARDKADAQSNRNLQKFFAFLDSLHAPWCCCERCYLLFVQMTK